MTGTHVGSTSIIPLLDTNKSRANMFGFAFGMKEVDNTLWLPEFKANLLPTFLPLVGKKV